MPEKVSETLSEKLPDRAILDHWAQALGFDAIGVTDIDLSAHAPHVQAFLRAQFHGDMGYLERNLEKRLQPDQLEDFTVRVISARMQYLAEDTHPLEVLQNSEMAYVSRYALGRDYHKVLRKRLAKLAEQIDAALPGYRYRAFTDSAPVLEKALAGKAGLGWMGKHTLMLDKTAGSWFFLGEIYTNAPFKPDTSTIEDACGKCTACMTVCPTQAIVDDKVLDARRCISYLTIENKGAIPLELRAAMGNRVFGCDDCQLFCPWNREAPTTSEADFKPRHGLDQSRLADLFALDADAFDQITQGSAMRRISYDQWQRNLAVGLGNGPQDDAVVKLLHSRLEGSSEMVAEHIRWAIERLTSRDST